MKAYEQLKILLFGPGEAVCRAAGRAAIRARTENIVFLSAKEAAFIYKQNQRVTRALTPDCPLFKKAGLTAHGAWCSMRCAKKTF